ncbi:hypothetical protein D9M68_557570 [compost metagenome]
MAEVRIGEAQALQAGVAGVAVGAFLFRPGDEAAALQLEEGAQFGGGEAFAEGGFLLGDDVEVHHRQVDPLQAELRAEQPAVDLDLRPVQRAVVVGDARDVAAVGLDLFQQVALGVVAVGAAADHQARILAGQRQFGEVAGAAPGDHRGMPGHALGGGRRRGEAQVEVALLGGEFAQRAHRDGVAHAGSAQRT